MPPVAELGQLEANAMRRLSPTRNRWPELRAIDERVADVERRLAETAERSRELHEKHANAPSVDADRLASWLDGQKGPRPVSSIPAIDEQITEAETEAAGLEILVGRELDAKSEYVQKHRARLVKDAAAHTAEAHERVVELVDQLEQARAALVGAREAALWGALYPGEQAGRGPQASLLAGGRAKPVRETLGLEVAVEYARVLKALAADALFWRDAGSTPEQRAAMDGTPGSARVSGADWVGTPEGVAAERAEKQARRERHAKLWGKPPGPT
ncbi:MAG: hypothetical protein WKF42_08055 [Solirubrobacteraceae bacterium]